MKTKENSNLSKNLQENVQAIKIAYVNKTALELAFIYNCSKATMERFLRKNLDRKKIIFIKLILLLKLNKKYDIVDGSQK